MNIHNDHEHIMQWRAAVIIAYKYRRVASDSPPILVTTCSYKCLTPDVWEITWSDWDNPLAWRAQLRQMRHAEKHGLYINGVGSPTYKFPHGNFDNTSDVGKPMIPNTGQVLRGFVWRRYRYGNDSPDGWLLSYCTEGIREAERAFAAEVGWQI